jgi:ribonucleoside-diphosphate reductase alpha chain
MDEVRTAVWPSQASPFGSQESSEPETEAIETPPVAPCNKPIPVAHEGMICNQCGGVMQRTGACHTCSSCGNHTGCG